jgi:hypothetical protein
MAGAATTLAGLFGLWILVRIVFRVWRYLIRPKNVSNVVGFFHPYW